MIHGSRRSIIVIHLSDSSVCRYSKNAANQRGTFKSRIALAAHNFVIGFGLLAIAPHDRGDWALENLFPVSQLIAVLIFYCYFKFTRLSLITRGQFHVGILLAIPIKEILSQFVQTSRRWMNFFTAAIVLAIGAFYELI